MHYPSHGQRFTGEPAYFEHITSAGRTLMTELGRTAKDFEHVVLHQPNKKFPERAAKMLGFDKEQWTTGLLSPVVGNTYAGASLLGLTAILDVAKPGDRILCVSFGSGAGSDAFSITATEAITARQRLAPTTQNYINRRTEIDYATYVRYRHKLHMH
jgi:hydroxymethylglutaryl-CoA synthase